MPQYMNVHSIRETVKQVVPCKMGKWLGEQIPKVGERSFLGNSDCLACDCFPAAVITDRHVLLLQCRVRLRHVLEDCFIIAEDIRWPF